MGSGLWPATSSPCSDSLSLRLRFQSLTLLQTITRRLMMQKARGHAGCCHRGASTAYRRSGFQNLFTPLSGVLFTFPSRYWFTIGLRGIFSLGGWSPQLRPGLHVSRATQDPASARPGFRIRGSNPLRPDFSDRSPIRTLSYSRGPTTPAGRTGWFGLLPVRSPLLRESRLISFPAGTEMFQFPAFASQRLWIHPWDERI